jgi:hypothetical protein
MPESGKNESAHAGRLGTDGGIHTKEKDARSKTAGRATTRSEIRNWNHGEMCSHECQTNAMAVRGSEAARRQETGQEKRIPKKKKKAPRKGEKERSANE